MILVWSLLKHKIKQTQLKKERLRVSLFLLYNYFFEILWYLKEIKTIKTMNLKEAKELFEEITELCYESENPKIIEIIEDIYSEVSESKDMSKIISSLEELQVAINEADFETDEEEELLCEVQEKIELLSE